MAAELSENFFRIFSARLPKRTNPEEEKSAEKSEKKHKEKKKRLLDSFGTNLTKKAREGLVDKVIGRDREIERLVQILNRRTKNNPALLGEPASEKRRLRRDLLKE